MAKTITEVIQQNKTLNPKLNEMTGESNTEAIRKMVQSTSGSAAGPSSGPARSSLREATARGAVAQQQANLALQGRLQNQELAAQAQGVQQAGELDAKTAREQAISREEAFNTQSMQILEGLERNLAQYDAKDRNMMFEASATLARAGRKNYLAELQTRAEREGILTESAWKRQMAKTILDTDLKFFRDNLLFENMLFEDKLEFRREMDTMSLEDAKSLAQLEARAANAQMFGQGISTTISGGMKAAEIGTRGKGESASLADQVDTSGTGEGVYTTPAGPTRYT